MHKQLWESEAPIDLAQSIARYTRWGVDLATVVSDGALFRVSAAGDAYRISQIGPTTFEVVSEGDIDTALAETRYRLDSLPSGAVFALGTRVPLIAERLAARPGYRPPMNGATLESLVASICAQQVNLRWAATTRNRLVELYGTRHTLEGVDVYRFPSAPELAAADPAHIREMQFTTRKSEYILEAASAVADGRLDGLAELDDQEVISRLTDIRGLGRWTAEWFLARTLARPHAIAAGDLGVRKAVSRFIANTDTTITEDEVRRVTAGWGDGGNWGMHLLLEGLSET